MIGSLLDRWNQTWEIIWEPLKHVPDTPLQMYGDLYLTAVRYFKEREKPQYAEQVAIANEPEKALRKFREIRGQHFKGETDIVSFFESAYEVLEEYDIEELVMQYFDLVTSFLSLYNLRYRLVRPFELLIQLPWIYADIYQELNEVNLRNPHLKELMDDFEHAFSRFALTKKRRDLRTAIAKASNYVEGVATTRLKLSQGKSLGELCDDLTQDRAWPHKNIKGSLLELYAFCNDYPGVRHAGTKNNRLRELEDKDTVIISTLLIAFSGYIQNQVSIKKILNG